METTSLIQEPQKKQKLNEEEDIDGNNKCLSNLPEEVLLHILSFLPTKDAVRTSVLSKRWEYMWVSIPNLVFERSLRPKRTLLMNFVDRALCLRDSDIKRFILSCDVLSDASRVNTWISAVVRHNVQELYIELENFKGDFSLPYCLFTCKTLTSLHLNMWYMILKLPPTICFSNLKILIIESVTFSNERLTQQLFSGLPVLEELQLHECKWGGLKTVSISAPKLRSLSIHEIEMQNWSYGDGRQVMIFGESLQEFYYDGFLHRDYCLYNSFSLEVSEIHVIDDDETPRQMAYHVYKLLIGLSNVKFLTLNCGMVEGLKSSAELLPHIPIFNNLISLTLDWCPVDLDCVATLKILQNSPCLKILKFLEGIWLWLDCGKDDWIPEPVPQCFLSHIKCIEVGSYDGDKKELPAIKILLKNAVVLDEIIISCSEHFAGNLEKQENFYKQLIEFPKGSQNCKIVLK